MNLSWPWGVIPPARAAGKSPALGAPYATQAALPAPNNNGNVGQPAHVNSKKPSDQRFRSFAERYIIARAHFFRVPVTEHTEDQWASVLDAKRVYAMIERVGQNIEPEEGVF